MAEQHEPGKASYSAREPESVKRALPRAGYAVASKVVSDKSGFLGPVIAKALYAVVVLGALLTVALDPSVRTIAAAVAGLAVWHLLTELVLVAFDIHTRLCEIRDALNRRP